MNQIFFRFRLVTLVVLIAAIVRLVIPGWRYLRPYVCWDEVRAATLSLLRSEDMSFLVMAKLCGEVSVRADTGNWLLGRREGCLSAPVSMYHGLDVNSIGPEAIRREGGKVIVRLPEPRALDYSVDLAGMRFLGKRSGRQILWDHATGRDIQAELRAQLKDSILAYFRDRGLLPTRAKIMRQLNQEAARLSRRVGAEIEFR